jgi:hypothetical protein
MVMSKSPTVAGYLAEQTPERRAEMEKVLRVLRKHMPKGYREGMGYGMMGWEVPLDRYPDTYNGQPLAYAGLAAQKNNFSLYLMGAYIDPGETQKLKDAFKAAGLRLDMGKSCIRFKRAADLPLEAIGQLIARWPLEQYIEAYESVRSPASKGKGAKAKGAKSARVVRKARTRAGKPKASTGARS